MLSFRHYYASLTPHSRTFHHYYAFLTPHLNIFHHYYASRIIAVAILYNCSMSFEKHSDALISWSRLRRRRSFYFILLIGPGGGAAVERRHRAGFLESYWLVEARVSARAARYGCPSDNMTHLVKQWPPAPNNSWIKPAFVWACPAGWSAGWCASS
jgi:hypothetical protein